jgi:O-succinylbenzoate synthase
VRAAFPGVDIAADANGSYDLDDREHLEALLALDDLGLSYLEQPLAPEALSASARLCGLLELPVVLDESINDLAGLERAITAGALDGCSIKAPRVGGLLPARALLERCCELGISAVVGGMLESGIGRAAALALAACPGFDLAGDLGASERYFDPDLTAPHELVGGDLLVPVGPGLGVDLDEEALDRALVASVRLG